MAERSKLVTRLVLFFLGVILMATSGGLSAAPAEQTLFYEAKLKSSSFGDMGTRRMWIKNDCMRWESMTKQLKMVVIKNSEGVFLLHPWKKAAGKYPAGTTRDNPSTFLPGPIGPTNTFLADVKATRSGGEKVGKEMCDIYTYQAPCDKRVCKLWVSKTSGKPVKLVVAGERRKTDTITAVYTKFEPGARIIDSQFRLPNGYSVRMIPIDKAADKKAA